MTKQNEQRQTAKIYPFPARRPVTAAARMQAPAAPVPNIEFGRGWYHQAAIDEANETCDPRRRQH